MSVALEPRDREPDGHQLQRLAHLVELEELLLRERADHRAAARPDGDEPFGGQPADRLADRPAADAQLLGERDLGELGAGLEPPGQDLGPQVVVHPLPESQVLDRRRAAESGLGCHCIHSPDGLG